MNSDAKPLHLHPDRLFPSDPVQRPIARRLYAQVAGLPIISPHGHTDPAWFAGDEAFANATTGSPLAHAAAAVCCSLAD